jgi:PucR family transcriptional regulator, purine catabolism regulatory protein
LNKSVVRGYECNVAITVRELIAIPDLRTWPQAGAAGLDREVAWAHVCELADPTEWLGEGDLLLTTGLGIPAEAGDQRSYVERLAAAGLSGLAIGDRMYAPALSPEMKAVADNRALPLLATSYEVPFSAVVRAVAEANRDEEHALLLDTLRLYETVQQAAISTSGPDLLKRLEELVGYDLYLLDDQRWRPAVRGAREPSAELLVAVRQASRRRAEPKPAVLRAEVSSQPVMILAVAASRPAVLVAVARREPAANLAVLRHVAGVAALELERETVERERKRHRGAEILAGLLEGRLPAETAISLLSEHGLDGPRWVIAACRTDAITNESDLHTRLDERGIAHVLLRRRPLLLALLADTSTAVSGLREEIDGPTRLGVSSTLASLSRVSDAEREARWALEAAELDRSPVTRYGEHTPALFLPRGLSEAERAVRHVLGALLDYDAAHNAELVKSLRTFLAHNRSWKDAANDLHIHKQTLVYRMRRVEELTGRRLDDTGDVAQLWFALKAAAASAPSPSAPPRPSASA